MSDTAGAGETRRPDELAAVTREYARYSRSRFGIALVWTGAWALAVAAIGCVRPGPGEILLRFIPLVWLIALPRARARYQRLGEVVEPERDDWSLFWGARGARRLAIAMIYCSSLVGIGLTVGAGPGVQTLAAIVFVAVPALAVHATRGAEDAVMTLGLTGIAAFVPRIGRGGFLPWWYPFAIAAAVAVVMLGKGLWDHARYRVIEERLAALRSPPA